MRSKKTKTAKAKAQLSKIEKPTKKTATPKKVKQVPEVNPIPNVEKKSEDIFKIENYLLDDEWKNLLAAEFEQDYFKQINGLLGKLYSQDKVKPAKENVFRAFNLTRIKDIKCVILGQDPYHDDEQAHGLAFSVPSNLDLPRTLKNIFKELEDDIAEFKTNESTGGCLEKWAHEGVFLLNTFLTVEAHKPGSHAKIGWNTFTDKVIQLISKENDACVFLLWGNFAHKKETLIDATKHKIIKSAHPSPLSFNKFFKSKCFSLTNDFLKSVKKTPINWSLI